MDLMTRRNGMDVYGERLGNYRVLLIPDPEAENPRSWDQFGTLWIRPSAERHYGSFGDGDSEDIDEAWQHFDRTIQDGGAVNRAMARWLRMVKGATNIKTVSISEHSTMTLGYHSANYVESPRDWGRFDGLMFDTTDDHVTAGKDITDEQVRAWLTNGLDTMRAWVEGNVYLIQAEKHGDCGDPDCDDGECTAWDLLDSIGSYYGVHEAEDAARQMLIEAALTTWLDPANHA